jgi:hypothetical protein
MAFAISHPIPNYMHCFPHSVTVTLDSESQKNWDVAPALPLTVTSMHPFPHL